jgi:threonyl-tRNA synthetase
MAENFKTPDSPDYRFALRHSAAHLMAQAVLRLYPQSKLTVGPVTDDGFFYDIDMGDITLSPENIQEIEKTMKKIVKENHNLRYFELSREEAKSFVKKQGQTYKLDLIDQIPADEPVTFYEQGDFTDLCEGPHVRRTGELKFFKLLNVSGSYWKGDQNNAQLQRIYGTAFESKELLDDHLRMIEEAKKRDHRELAKRLDLFSFHHWSPGIPFMHPRGTFVYNRMQDYVRDLYNKYDYKEVITPQIYDQQLYKQSGHMESFAEFMFQMPDENNQVSCLKPMNCPGHCLFYKGQLFSYKELPLRIAEFSKLHRNEKSGALHGITRVRAMSQDDAHIFCTEDQIEAETNAFFDFTNEVYKTFGFDRYEVKLALRPEKRVGDEALWDKAENILQKMLEQRGVPFELQPGEGAFYGPKYEFHIKDAIGRSWQLATLQLDFALPERFDLEYVAKDGNRHRPVMIHRAIFGSLERFFGVYLEHSEGYFPTWLAPTQMVVVPVREEHYEYAQKLATDWKSLGLRVEADLTEGNMGGKVRKATVQRVPYIAVVGDKEKETMSLSIKSPKFGDFGSKPVSLMQETLLLEMKQKSLESLLIQS